MKRVIYQTKILSDTLLHFDKTSVFNDKTEFSFRYYLANIGMLFFGFNAANFFTTNDFHLTKLNSQGKQAQLKKNINHSMTEFQ